MKTFRKLLDCGRWVEYRVVLGVTVWFLETRFLGLNGQPYPDGWYRCGDGHITDFQRHHPGVIESLIKGQ